MKTLPRGALLCFMVTILEHALEGSTKGRHEVVETNVRGAGLTCTDLRS